MRDEKNIPQMTGLSPDDFKLLAYMLAEEGVELQPAQTILPRPDIAEIPLSFGQQRLWFLDQLEPGNPVYNLTTAVRLKGHLDVPALEQTLTEVVRRHEALRTTFSMSDGRPIQIIHDPQPCPIPLIEIAHLPEDEREQEAERRCREAARRAFDLSRGPLWRALLLRLAAGEYVLVFTMHHIVSDGWSRGVLIREVAALYQAYLTGQPHNLPDLSIQYADFAVWQREWLQGEVLESQLSYWRRQLKDLAALELPADRLRPATQSFRGAKQSLALSHSLLQSLKTLSQREGATLFMTLLAAFKTVLHRYSHQDDICIGTPIASRTRAALEPLIGFFTNMLVLRTNLSGDPSFRELLRREQQVCMDAYAHQDVPFEKLVEELQPERDLSHTPLFQVVFALQNTPRQGLDLPGLSLSLQGVNSETAKFDLTLVMEENEQSLVGTFEYNTDLFDKATISRLLAHFQTLLEGVAANPDSPISALPLLTPAERERLLAQCNARRADYRQAICLHQLFEAQAESNPEAVALTFEQEQLTYQQLNRRANQLAHYLKSLGVGPEVQVAICLERSPQMVIALLGVLKAGGAYVPLDPAYPQQRLAFMLADTRAPVLLIQDHLVGALPDYGGKIVSLDADRDMIASHSEENPPHEAVADNAAYLIYTSGSTGQAKGTVVTHSNVTRLLAATQSWFSFGHQDVWTLFHSSAFDFSVWELWGALAYGGRLVIVPYWVSRNPEAFYQLLNEERVTVLNQTPSAFRQLMRVEESVEPVAELALRFVIFGGEALEPGTLSPWVERRGDERPQLINMYGITETTVHVTYRRLKSADITAGGRRSVIGSAIPDLQVYVLDERLEPTPVGVAGEMYVGGAGVARGYWQRAELTAERFIPHPFSLEPGARLYRTGDVGRYLVEGEIEYLGRADNQVKVRGYRIELGEIEAVLTTHPAVREALVLAREDEAGDKQIVAYLTLKQEVGNQELRSYVGERVPEYMIPAWMVMMEEMPLTANGKIDRSALPAPDGERPTWSEEYVAPRTEVEELLAVIWAKILGLERVGIHDNFFALGGDSIRSVRLLALARERGLDFSLQELFRSQTIYQLAKELRIGEVNSLPEKRSEPFSLVSEADRSKLPGDLEDAYPLTMLQAGMLYHMALTPDAPVYHNVNSWHLRARFEPEVFQEAVRQVVVRHAILRTSFDLTSYSEPLQLVHQAAHFPTQVTDLRHLSADQQEDALNAYVEAEKNHRFDLSLPPLLRFHIHLRTAETFQFTLTESHPIFDGWSLNSTLAEIFTKYFALLNHPQLLPEPPPTVTFRDFVLLERMALESAECQRYWDEKLHDCQVIELPRWPASYRQTDGPQIQTLPVPISGHLSEALKRVARLAQVPVKSVLLAAHLKVLSLISGQNDVVGGLVCNGRPEEIDGEQVRGMFLNTVPLRLNLPAGTWADLVRAAFDAEWELLPSRRFPLIELQRRMGGPLFEVQFNYVHFHALDGILRSGEIEVLADSKRVSEEAHFTMTAAFGMNPASSQVYLLLQYNAAQLCREQMQAYASYYLETLNAIAEDPLALHHVRSLLPEKEQDRLLFELNRTEMEFTGSACLHELFEEQVARTPGAIAVVFEDQQVSYEELNRRANQLARYLRKMGIGPEVLVGILMERSIEMVVALLGVLKAGGAYVPLDPAYPQERLQFMLKTSRARVLLTHQRLADPLGALEAQLIQLDAEWEKVGREEAGDLGQTSFADNLAYVIYTSGSTGRPKGVMISQRAIANHMRWLQATFPLTVADRVLQKTAFSFDASVWEFYAPLFAGAQLIMARADGHRNTAYLVQVINERQVTILQLVPTLLRVLLQESGFESCRSLRRVFCGGESLTAETANLFHDLLPAELVNFYGPTEATINTTYQVCSREMDGRNVPIGRPVANVHVYLLGPSLQPVPPGTPGELYIGGAALARGYLERPDLTVERFIPDPFGVQQGARLYRTGDLARYLPDGSLEFVGRVDQQVKVRGFRIELGEIEEVLTQHPLVKQAVVLLHEDVPGDARLIAYLVAQEESFEALQKEAHNFAKERLPNYMMPTAFVTLEQLPFTPSGKLDRRALPAPGQHRPALEVAYVAPQTEVERLVAGIWQEVLGVEQVGINDNFFELGGHSLRLLQVYHKLREVFAEKIEMVDLFQYSSVSALAKHLSLERREELSLAASEERGEKRKKSATRQRQRRQTHRVPLN